jgi:hypothetical protein
MTICSLVRLGHIFNIKFNLPIVNDYIEYTSEGYSIVCGNKESTVDKGDGKWTITRWKENGQIYYERIYKNGVCISENC